MRRIAIVGAGISGLGAARLLADGNDVVIYESADRLGGHARTIAVDRPGCGTVAVDTGFIVYNEVNYPRLTALFAELGIETAPTNMSFGVSAGGLEMCGSSLSGVFAQRRNFFSPAHWIMLRDILRFFRRAPDVLGSARDPSLGQMINELQVGAHARDKFLVPMGAAIWSMPPGQILDMPAKTFVGFFQVHNLLSASGHHAWRTVAGGSRVYVEALSRLLTSRLRVDVRCRAAVRSVVQLASGRHEVITGDGARDGFDDVVLACPADTALALISQPTRDETSVLSAFSFRDNHAVLHGDTQLMPKARAAWASWIYTGCSTGGADSVSVTYWMNQLQNLPGPPLFVTLNASQEIDERTVIDRHTFRHPVLSRGSVAAQASLPEIQGKRGLWFCGAWARYGFHEDGLWSASEVAKGMRVRRPAWA